MRKAVALGIGSSAASLSCLGLIVEHEVQHSALLNYDFEHPCQVNYNITKNNHRAYMLDALQEANRKLLGR